MIPATKPYTASYKHENKGGPYFTTKPVIAWSEAEGALVADEKTGRLRAASTWTNFAGVSEEEPLVVGIIPGTGWTVAYRDDDGTQDESPLVAWIVRADGSMTPMDADSSGECGDPTDMSNFVAIGPSAPLDGASPADRDGQS